MGVQYERGKEGEQLAVEYLISRGYTIIQRNYRYLKAEIDIIAKKDNILAIVEVKYRSSRPLGNIAESVSRKKIRLLVMAADHFVTERQMDVEIRFDIVTLQKSGDTTRIQHLEDAFYHF